MGSSNDGKQIAYAFEEIGGHSEELTSSSLASQASVEEISSFSGEDSDDSSSTISHNQNLDEVVIGHDEEISCDGSFQSLKFTYLTVMLVIYLADGLQGTHLYKLYAEYGFSVSSLYCLGFFTGGILSPVTGPLVDKIGRKQAAVIYCLLEIIINTMEQYPYLFCLVASRMLGGLTTNLLHSVFETWLDTEYRKRGLDKARYEILMRDSVIVSNAAAIGSGYLSHLLSERCGAVGPFRGAVGCTTIALAVVASLWTENYGGTSSGEDESKSVLHFLSEATEAFRNDTMMLKVGVVQGLAMGSLQIFVFLWSPILMKLAERAPEGTVGLDGTGEPAFGLIFMVFMSACVLGGMAAPLVRKAMTWLLSPLRPNIGTMKLDVDGVTANDRPMAVEFLAACCYIASAGLMFVPCLVSGENAFFHTLLAFVLYETLIGIVSPCEGVIRSLYFPANARASVLTLPSLVVNAAVSFVVFATEFTSIFVVASIVTFLMTVAGILQLSLISSREWSSLSEKVRQSPSLVRSLSYSAYESVRSAPSDSFCRLSHAPRILRRCMTEFSENFSCLQEHGSALVRESEFPPAEGKVKRE